LRKVLNTAVFVELSFFSKNIIRNKTKFAHFIKFFAEEKLSKDETTNGHVNF